MRLDNWASCGMAIVLVVIMALPSISAVAVQEERFASMSTPSSGMCESANSEQLNSVNLLAAISSAQESQAFKIGSEKFCDDIVL